MNSILEIIKPIKLLKGHHADTGTTGQGCTMDVISYLNGDKIITDHTDCVCFVVTPIVIWLQDLLTDDERYRMIPYIPRLVGSRSNDKAIFLPRAEAVVSFAKKCSEIAAESAAKSAESAAWAAWAELLTEIISAAFLLLDELLPPTPPTSPAVVERARALIAITA